MENKKLSLGELIQCVQLEDVNIFDYDEEHDYASIVELNANTLTEEGKKHFSKVLNAEVVKIFEGGEGVHILIRGTTGKRVEDFSFALAGYCSEENFKKWFNESLV